MARRGISLMFMLPCYRRRQLSKNAEQEKTGALAPPPTLVAKKIKYYTIILLYITDFSSISGNSK